MAIDVRDLATRPLDPVIAEELDIFERTSPSTSTAASTKTRSASSA